MLSDDDVRWAVTMATEVHISLCYDSSYRESPGLNTEAREQPKEAPWRLLTEPLGDKQVMTWRMLELPPSGGDKMTLLRASC